MSYDFDCDEIVMMILQRFPPMIIFPLIPGPLWAPVAPYVSHLTCTSSTRSEQPACPS